MTTGDPSPQRGIAAALGTLSEQTRLLVRREIDAAQREMLAKAKAETPALGMAAGAAVLGLFAAAAGYRLSLRLLEKALPPASAALVATVGYGAAAGALATVAVQRLRTLPPPLPTDTAQEAGGLLQGTAEETRRTI